MSLFKILGAVLIGPLKLIFEVIFSIAYNMLENSDGTYTIYFDVYSDTSVSGGDVLNDNSVYSLTSDEAKNKYNPVGTGHTVVKTKVYEGKDTYEIISYNVKNL